MENTIQYSAMATVSKGGMKPDCLRKFHCTREGTLRNAIPQNNVIRLIPPQTINTRTATPQGGIIRLEHPQDITTQTTTPQGGIICLAHLLAHPQERTIHTAIPQGGIICLAHPQDKTIHTAIPQGGILRTATPQNNAVRLMPPQKINTQTATPQGGIIRTATPQKNAVRLIPPQKINTQTATPQGGVIRLAHPQERSIRNATPHGGIICLAHLLAHPQERTIHTAIPQGGIICLAHRQDRTIRTATPQNNAVRLIPPQKINTQPATPQGGITRLAHPQERTIHTAIPQGGIICLAHRQERTIHTAIPQGGITRLAHPQERSIRNATPQGGMIRLAHPQDKIIIIEPQSQATVNERRRVVFVGRMLYKENEILATSVKTSSDIVPYPERLLREGSGGTVVQSVFVKEEPGVEPQHLDSETPAIVDSTSEISYLTNFCKTWDHTYSQSGWLSTEALVKQDPELNAIADRVKVETDSWSSEVVKEEPLSDGDSRGVSEAAALAGLYPDHVVKDELVLGPERPYQPFKTPLDNEAHGFSSDCFPESVREPRGKFALRECSVRLERIEPCLTTHSDPDTTSQTTPEHDVTKTYVCDICRKTIKRKDHLIRHINKHLRDNTRAATANHKRSFASLSHLDTNIKVRQREKTSRALRGSASDTTLHRNGTHEATNTHVCDICGKTIKRKDHLIRHINLHLRENSETISNKNNIYERVRSIEKPYGCKICKKEFSRFDNLQRHERIHSGEKAYACEICKRKFAHLCNLTAHKRIHTGEKPYSCEICKMQFAELGTLKKHKRIHSGEKSYSCETCNKAFAYFTTLKRHKRIHSGAKPYACEICEEGFMRLDTLKTHLRSHEGGKSENKRRKSRRAKAKRNS